MELTAYEAMHKVVHLRQWQLWTSIKYATGLGFFTLFWLISCFEDVFVN